MLKKTPFQWVYGGLFLLYFGVLPISNTIALRNVALAILTGCVLWVLLFARHRLQWPLAAGVSAVPKVFWVWVAFLVLFPLWAPDGRTAWANLGGQWLESLLAWLVAFGCIMILGRDGPSLWTLALASTVPIFLHLLMTVAAWVGLFPNPMPEDVTVTTFITFAWKRYWASGLEVQGFPWGFRGLEPMHGNLGYTACQSIALFAALGFFGLLAQKWKTFALGWAGVMVCFASVLIANSRGAIVFGLVMLGFMAAVYVFRISKSARVSTPQRKAVRWTVGVLSGVAALAFLAFAFQSVRSDARWAGMRDKIEIGLGVADPVDVLCNGVSNNLKEHIRTHYAAGKPGYADELISGVEGDGSRVMLMRVGFQMVADNPWGLDGSRHSYKRLMEEKCGHVPVLQYAHSHQGWVDTFLSFGWVGALVFAGLLLVCVARSWCALTREHVGVLAFALLSLSVFWVVRGSADSVYREHYLQMQAAMLGILYLKLGLESASKRASA